MQLRARSCASGGGTHLAGMHPPIFVREPNAEERARLEAASRASDAFTVRRSDRAPERGGAPAPRDRPRPALRRAGCARRRPRFDAAGTASLTAGSSRPKSAAPVPGAAELGRLRTILHRPPLAFGHARSTWTLALLAEVPHAEG